MKEIEQKYWNVVDFNVFRDQLPELKFKENQSLTAIINGQTTDLIDVSMKENKIFNEKTFAQRFEEYKSYLNKLFQQVDKKTEVSVQSPKKKM